MRRSDSGNTRPSPKHQPHAAALWGSIPPAREPPDKKYRNLGINAVPFAAFAADAPAPFFQINPAVPDFSGQVNTPADER